MEATSYSLPHRLKAWELLELKKYPTEISTNVVHKIFVFNFQWVKFVCNLAPIFNICLPCETIGLSVRDFAIDPTQDTVVFLEDGLKYVIFTLLSHIPSVSPSPSFTLDWTVCLYIRTISSNRPHPLACEGILSFDIHVDTGLGNPVFNTILQLAYDMFSLSIVTGPNFHGLRALVWNWKTGRLVFVCLIFFFFSILVLNFLAFAKWSNNYGRQPGLFHVFHQLWCFCFSFCSVVVTTLSAVNVVRNSSRSCNHDQWRRYNMLRLHPWLAHTKAHMWALSKCVKFGRVTWLPRLIKMTAFVYGCALPRGTWFTHTFTGGCLDSDSITPIQDVSSISLQWLTPQACPCIRRRYNIQSHLLLASLIVIISLNDIWLPQ